MQIRELTGIRFVAAFIVLISHSYQNAFHDRALFISTLAETLAYLGMSLFFCLSGFVIYSGYRDIFRGRVVVNVYNFAVARFARLYPLYAFAMLVMVVGNFPGSARDAIHYALLVQSWFNNWTVTFLPAWSISTEAFFYAAFIFIGAPLVAIRRPVAALIVLTGAGFAVSYLWLHADPKPMAELFRPIAVTGHDSLSDIYGWLRYVAPYTRVVEFVMGALTAKIVLETDAPRRLTQAQARATIYGALALIGLMLFSAAWSIHADTKGFLVNVSANYLYAPAICLLMAVLPGRKTKINKLLAGWLFVGAGELSYSLYLMQFVASDYVSGWDDDAIGQMGIFIVATFVISICTYAVIEVPGRQIIRRYLSYRPSAQPAGAAQ